MRLQMEMAEKLADGFSPHAAFEAKHKQSGHDQADEPVSACLGFPQRRLRIAVAAVHRLEVTMHTAFGKSGVLRKASDALLPVFTNRVENDQALGPQSHSGGPCSEGWLTWCLKSALQSTRSTTHCPALETWPAGGSRWPCSRRTTMLSCPTRVGASRCQAPTSPTGLAQPRCGGRGHRRWRRAGPTPGGR